MIESNMVDLVHVFLAEFGAIKGLAILGALIVGFLFWDNFKEKRTRRREKQALEERRRQAQARNK